MIRRSLITILVVLIVGGAFCAEAQSLIRIRGRVVFEPTGKPLKDVKVELIRPDRSLAARIKTAGNEGTPEMLGTTKADVSGNFSFEIIRPGPYEIMCFRPGGHIASGAPNVNPREFVLIRYKADATSFALRPGDKPPPIKQ